MNNYEEEQDVLLRERRLAKAGPAFPSPHLISTVEIAARAADPRIVLLQVDHDPDLAGAHIPGALPLDWRRDLIAQDRRDIASREQLELVLQSAGAEAESTIVLYGDCHNWFASFGAWILRLYGVADVRLLDGGKAKWLAEGRPLTDRIALPREGSLRLGDRDDGLRATLADVLAVVNGARDAVLLDVRSPQEFAGTEAGELAEGAARPGHIPGAINIPWGLLVDADGTYRSAQDLRRIFAEHGVDGSREIITYCQIGERSGHSWFALTQLLGYRARNYDGSWSEYGNCVGLPIENPSHADPRAVRPRRSALA